MALFNNSNVSNTNRQTDTNTTIITAGAKTTGEINLSCKLYVDGEIEGKITSSQDITIGHSGHIKGEILAKKLVIQGLVEGSVDAEIVEIKASGHFKGEIKSQELIIESKGIFEGNSTIKDKAEQKILPKNTKHAEH